MYLERLSCTVHGAITSIDNNLVHILRSLIRTLAGLRGSTGPVIHCTIQNTYIVDWEGRQFHDNSEYVVFRFKCNLQTIDECEYIEFPNGGKLRKKNGVRKQNCFMHHAFTFDINYWDIFLFDYELEARRWKLCMTQKRRNNCNCVCTNNKHTPIGIGM